MTTPDNAPGLPGDQYCATCGERIKPGRTPGTYTHVTRLVAACDLNSDHTPTPRPAPEPARPAE